MIILVAEDKAVVAVLLELTLRGAGHEVLGPAPSAEEALRLAEGTRPDLALLDIVLRDRGDGVALARALRDRHGTPVLFLSGQTAQARATADAALGLLGKPYGPPGRARRGRGRGGAAPGREARADAAAARALRPAGRLSGPAATPARPGPRAPRSSPPRG